MITKTPDIAKFQSDEFTMKRLEKAFAHNNKIGGGTIEIEYRGTVVLAPMRDVLYGMERLKSYTPTQHHIVMNSVNESINDNFDKMLNHEIDTKRAVEIMQDIAIWFANEVNMGRAELP